MEPPHKCKFSFTIIERYNQPLFDYGIFTVDARAHLPVYLFILSFDSISLQNVTIELIQF